MDREGILAEHVAGARPGFAVLRLSGPLEMENVPVFLKVVRAEKAPALILDFSGVTYLDSAGVGALVQSLVGMRNESRRLALVNPNSRVRSVLEVTRVESLFVIAPTVAEAEAQLGGAGSVASERLPFGRERGHT